MRKKLRKRRLHSSPGYATSDCVIPKISRALLLFCLLQLCMLNAFAQNKIVSGVVKNGKDEPLIAVTVSLKGTDKATSTDTEGRFSIEVPSGKGVLVFTSVGHATKEINVNNRSVIDV